jgi:DmsE family decaheme c-type cytochrome
MTSKRAILLLAAAALGIAPAGVWAQSSKQRSTRTASDSAAVPTTTRAATPATAQAAKSAADKYKLKPDARGKACLRCHAGFKERLEKPFVHTPLRQGECTGCHNPHTSDHGKLLAAGPTGVCSTCHDMTPAQAKSAHKPVAEGKCIDCHDGHSSNEKYLLTKPATQMCAGCHTKLAEAASSAKVPHHPVTQGCGTCHTPHASASPALLKKGVPGLCTDCHKTNRPMFAKAHRNYPVAATRCTECHDPHGSERKGILYNDVHAPVARGNCGACHEEPNHPKRFAPKKAAAELCRGCHAETVSLMFDKNRVHQPVHDETACLNCHAAHASSQPALLKGGQRAVCGSCHPDSLTREARSPTTHPPVREGSCTKCHEAHASDGPLLMKTANSVDTCGTCHEWQRHSSHPLGDKVKDPRNPNLSVQCLSCHRAHGTEFQHLMPYRATSDLCVACHQTFRR